MEGEQPDISNLFLGVPFSKRWECHKDTICRLYINEHRALEDVANVMKQDYRFDANVRQYKYHLKKWDAFKSVPSSVKQEAIQTLGKRIRDGKEFGGIRYRGVEIEKKRLRRYIKDDTRLNKDFTFASPGFGRWNLPYNALVRKSDNEMIVVTPGGCESSTPSDYSVISPRPNGDHSSPMNASSPANAPTPTTRAIQVRTHRERSMFFIQGDIDGFLKGMSRADKKIATTWLHDYWTFAFITSKYWGKGPKRWTTDLLSMAGVSALHSLPGSPSVARESGAPSPLSTAEDQYGSRPTCHERELPQPSLLCRWCIHVHTIDYEHIPSPPPEEQVDYDAQDPDNWPSWAAQPCTIVERLNNALQDNSFSSINTQHLPVSTAVIATAAASSPEAMTAEAFRFAIMARNVDLAESIIEKSHRDDPDFSTIYPFHLAASYLDGGSICCDMFYLLVDCLFRQNAINKLYVNDLSHTVLDSLMLTILKGHTSCTPIMVDENLKTMAQFPGEEIDLCGRWDADSPCLRALHANGSPSVPFSWKHMFCHTSVQAICHSMTALFSYNHSPNINTPSGLFAKTCFSCGKRLAPGPLHTLVLTAFYLAQHGCQEENLFGMVACLVCLLTQGADPTYQADLSISELLGIGEQQHCTHEPLDPVELGRQVPPAVFDCWSEERKLGWDCLMEILLFAQRERICDNSGDVDSDDDRCDHGFFHKSRRLGTLWCAIQTELVSYRRLQDGEAWHSNNFNLKVIRDGAANDGNFSRLPLIDKGMMKPICRCGRFESNFHNRIVTVDKACSFYFSNMDEWGRSTYRQI